MSKTNQLSFDEAELVAVRDRADINAREASHWYKKFMDLKAVVDDAIQRSNGQDPAMNIILNHLDTATAPNLSVDYTTAR